MTVRTFTSREFLRDTSVVKKAALQGPVFITDRGKPRFVLQTVESYYQQNASKEPTFLELMDSIDGGGDIAFDPPRLQLQLRVPDLS